MKTQIDHVLLWSLICLVLLVVMLGFPHHWSALSLVGKLIAQYVGNVVVFALAAWALMSATRRGLQEPRPKIAGIAAGLLGVVPSTIIAFFLTCALTLDCP